jgi:hypothetical protein
MRISFNENDACHLYELSLEHFQNKCGQCEKIKSRLEKFIGKENVRHIKRQVKKYPYCE